MDSQLPRMMDWVRVRQPLSPTGITCHVLSPKCHLFATCGSTHRLLTLPENPRVMPAMYILDIIRRGWRSSLYDMAVVRGRPPVLRVGNRLAINSHCSLVISLGYALVIRSQGAGFFKSQHKPCEFFYTLPPLLKPPLTHILQVDPERR